MVLLLRATFSGLGTLCISVLFVASHFVSVSVLFVCVGCPGLWMAWADMKLLQCVRWAFDDDHRDDEDHDHDHSVCVHVLHGCCMHL